MTTTYIGPCLIAAALTAAAVLTPDLQYRSSSTVVIHGMAGEAISLLSRLGGAPEVIEETVSLRGDVMRTDTEGQSTLIDLYGERFIHLHHDRQSYTVLTFDDIRDRLRQPLASASSEDTGDAGNGDESTAEVHLDLIVERTGQRDRINGFAVERVLLTITAEASAKDPDAETQALGSLVVANELWMSPDVDGFEEVLAFRRRLAEQLGAEAIGARKGLLDVLKKSVENDPRIRQALEQLEAETAKLQGVPVRGTTEVLIVPAGATYDPQGLFVEKPPKETKKKGGLRSLARGLADKMKDGSASAKEPEQKRLLSIRTEILDIMQGPLQPSLFDVPTDYAAVDH